jgi:hypothetical protein
MRGRKNNDIYHPVNHELIIEDRGEIPLKYHLTRRGLF